MADCIHQLDLCPDCDGLRVTELTSVGTVDISLDAGPFSFSGPAELYIGPAPEPCDNDKPQP
jgi:hypothetical protein